MLKLLQIYHCLNSVLFKKEILFENLFFLYKCIANICAEIDIIQEIYSLNMFIFYFKYYFAYLVSL